MLVNRYRLLFVICLMVFCLSLIMATQSQAGDFFQWEDHAGNLAFTDNPKHVPPTHKPHAVERSWKELDVIPVTLVVKQPDVVPLTSSRREVNSNRLSDCTGPITVTSERRQFDEYNRRIFIVTNECGRVTSVTTEYPSLRINR
jgi:hypothetical protein